MFLHPKLIHDKIGSLQVPRLPAERQPVTPTPPSKPGPSRRQKDSPFPEKGISLGFDNLRAVLANHIKPDLAKSLYHFLSESHGLASSLLPSPYQKKKKKRRSDTIHTLLHITEMQVLLRRIGDTAII